MHDRQRQGDRAGAAEDTNDYAEKFTILRNQVAAAAIPLGVTLFGRSTSLMPTFERVIGFVAGLIEKFAALPTGCRLASWCLRGWRL